jgi:hypothetical protein
VHIIVYDSQVKKQKPRKTIALPLATYQKLVAEAKKHGFQVSRGRFSELGRFLNHLIQLSESTLGEMKPPPAGD